VGIIQTGQEQAIQSMYKYCRLTFENTDLQDKQTPNTTESQIDNVSYYTMHAVQATCSGVLTL